MEAALVSSQTAETKVERRIGWILRNRLPEIQRGRAKSGVGEGGREGGVRELDSDARAGEPGGGGCRQTLGCMRQVHTSSRPRAIQRLSTIQTWLSRSLVPSFSRFRSPSLLVSLSFSLSLCFLPVSLSFSFPSLESQGSLILGYATTYRRVTSGGIPSSGRSNFARRN